MKYASRGLTSWQIETVDSAGDVGRHTSLAVDARLPSFNFPHIVYRDQTTLGSHFLKYATKVGGSWIIEAVDSSSHGAGTSIHLDVLGDPHVARFQSDTKDGADEIG